MTEGTSGAEQLTLAEALADDAAFALDPPVASPPIAAPATGLGEITTAPRIRRLWLRNFKGFVDFEVTLGEFNVLAGANNSGKSTILQGADLLFRLIDLHREGSHLARGRNVPPGLLPIAQLRDLWYGRRYRSQNKFIEAIVGGEFADGVEIEFGVIGPFAAANSRLRLKGSTDETLRVLAARPAVWVPSSVGLARAEEYRPAARRLGLVAEGRHNEVLRNQLLELSKRKSDFEELERILETHFGGRLESVRFDELVDQFVTATYEESSVQHDLYSVGSGFVQVVQLLAFILPKNPSVVLLDEPDAHLHSSLQKTVIDVLDNLSRTRGFQLLVSTHSKEIINYVDPSRLILVEKGASKASPFGPAVTLLSILQSVGSIDNVDAFALVRNKRCLFLEGQDDELVIERFAARLGRASFSGDDRIVVVGVGGADRFEHVEQLTVFEGILGSAIASFEIRDRDGSTDSHRSDAMSKATRPLRILERDSIESYLVNPIVLARVVANVADDQGKTLSPTAVELERLILEETDKLMDRAHDRIADRYMVEERRINGSFPTIAEANIAARAAIAAHWGALDDRLVVAPGKPLLAAVRNRIQTEYGTSFGTARLVEEFEVAEIPEELKTLLAEVDAAVGPGTKA